MKFSTACFAVSLLLCLVLSVNSASAQELYDNGMINGQTDAWTINFGFVVSDTFTVCCKGDGPADFAQVTGMSFGAWLEPGDTLINAEVSITSSEFGGTTFFDGTVPFTQSGCNSNEYGFSVCTETGSFSVTLAYGTYWLNLQNATTSFGDPVYWDENSGVGCGGTGGMDKHCPSMASENSVGTIPSESFTIFGSYVTSTGTTPEPSGILLLGSGILTCAGVWRRKRKS